MKTDEAIARPFPARFGKSDLQQLGSYLRDKRKALGLTMRQLSDLSGVSSASISAMETARSSPSLTSVLNIVQALGLRLDETLEEAVRSKKRAVISRAGAGKKEQSRHLSAQLADARLDAQLVTLPPGGMLSVPDDIGNAPSLCMAIEGVVITSLNDARRIKLDAGDAYRAQAGKVSAWANAGSATSRLLCVTDRTTPRKVQ